MADPVGDGREVPYENTAAERWAELALQVYKEGKLRTLAFNTEGVVSAHVWGMCPRCHHELNIQKTLTAAVVVDRGFWPQRRSPDAGVPDSIEVACGCGRTHDGAPANLTGCGVSFRLPANSAEPRVTRE